MTTATVIIAFISRDVVIFGGVLIIRMAVTQTNRGKVINLFGGRRDAKITSDIVFQDCHVCLKIEYTNMNLENKVSKGIQM